MKLPTLVPECFERQILNGEVSYLYVHRFDRTAWNVDAIDIENDTVHLWSINANGKAHYRTSELSEFWKAYEEYNPFSIVEDRRSAPSLGNGDEAA